MNDICEKLESITIYFGSGKKCEAIVSIPCCIIDSHMHIVSGRCTPLPLLWNKGLFGGRKTIERLATTFIGKIIGGRNTGEIQKLPCDKIGERAVYNNYIALSPQFSQTFKEYNGYRLYSILVIMPMDMEYAHLDGYDQETIYKFKNDKYYYFKRDENNPLKKKEIPGKEVELFITWRRQVDQTKKAIKNHPWKLVSMYHYDPRRWKNKWDLPFKEIVTPENSGLFWGFKMYPPLGYKPLDNENKLPNLRKFYSLCQSKRIPILTHCSAGGMITHEWKFFLQYETDQSIKSKYEELSKFFVDYSVNEINKTVRVQAPYAAPFIGFKSFKELLNQHKNAISFIKSQRGINDNELKSYIYQRYSDGGMSLDARWDYFKDEFIHPYAWKKVLSEFGELKLCLAHFGGEYWTPNNWHKGDENDWIKEIIELIKLYDNVYTDISYFNYKKDYQTEFEKFIRKVLAQNDKKILNHIMFGTDWYMTEIDNLFYKNYCDFFKKYLDKIDKSLWIRFAIINPFKFYRIDKIANNYSEALKNIGVNSQRIDNAIKNIELLKLEIDGLEKSL